MADPWKRKVVIGEATLYLGLAEDILPLLDPVDSVVTDPPYGIGEAAGKAKTRTSGLTSKLRNAQLYRRDYGDDDWDDKPISQELMGLVMAAGRWKIIFGGNYYALPATSCWLVWDKLNGDTDFADCELAWTNLPKAVRRLRFLWNGCMRNERHIEREHPTQKPVGVMSWCMSHLPDDCRTILDPFMGSATTGVACAGKYNFIGIERNPKFFDIAVERITNAQRQTKLFDDPKPKPIQEALI